MSKGSNRQTTQQSSSVGPDPQAMAAYSSLLSRATNVSNTPFQAYGGPETAPINERQLFGADAGQLTLAGFAPYAGEAGYNISQAGTPVSTGDISQYMDPFTNSVINATQADFDVQNKRAKSITDSGAAAQGALGGNRVGVAEALTQEGQERVQAPVMANLRSQGFQQAVQNANAQKQRQMQSGQIMTQADLSAAQQQFAFGTQEQQTQQAAYTQAMTDYYTKQGYDFATAQWLAGIVLGTGSQMGQTSTGTSATQGPQPNQWAQAAGVGLSALAMFSDERLKENVKEIGRLHDGQKIYRYNFKGDPTTQVGMLSQEVEKEHPEAVGKVAGFGTVDYDKATEDAVKRWSGGAIRGFAEGGTPYGPGTQGWVPTIGKIGGATLKDPGVNSPKMGEEKGADYSKMGKDLGTIGKGLWDKMDFGGSSGWDWGSDPTGGMGALEAGAYAFRRGGPVSTGFASGGHVRGFEDGGVPSFDDRFSAISDEPGVPPVKPIKMPDLTESKGFEPVEPSLTGVEREPIPASEVPLPRGKPDTVGGVRATMANELARAGGPPVAISGINMAVRDESNFNPGSITPYDQKNPKFAGTDAMHGHGLFQEGGDEWNKYKGWLQKNAPDADWKDPSLQTKFLAENLRENYPYVWANMVNARTPGEAAAIFTSGYLKPAKQHEVARVNKYLGQGEEGETNPDLMKASFRPGLDPGYGVPRGQPPYIPGVAGPQEPKPRAGMGGFNPLGLSDEARQGLISMGLGMMANRRGGSGSFLASLGEGGEQGMTTYASARAATAARDALERKEAFEREKFSAEYSQMKPADKIRLEELRSQNEFNRAKTIAQLQETQRAHNLALRTPIKYAETDRGTYYALPKAAPDGTVEFWPITVDPKSGAATLGSSPLGGSMAEAAKRNAPPELQQQQPQASPGGPELRSAAYNPDEGVVTANSKLEKSGQPFDYSRGDEVPVIEKGMFVPDPAPVSSRSTQAIQLAAEQYIQTGKLPAISRGNSPVAKAQNAYRNTVENYANALLASRDISPQQAAEMWRTNPGMLRFVLGADGRATVSLGTAVRHLDTLRDLAKAWNSGDIQTLNRIKAVISRQFGNSAVTSLEAASNIVGAEIIKAIIGSQSGEREREAAAKQFGPLLSGPQMYGNIDTVQKLLGGQLEGKKRQAANAGVSEERFKSLIGEGPYDVLTKAEKGGTGSAGAVPPGAKPMKRRDGTKVWQLPDGSVIPRE